MSDVRAYTPGTTGTIADVLETGPELRPVQPTGDDGAPAPSLLEQFSASRRLTIQDNLGGPERIQREGWEAIIDALGLPAHQNPSLNFGGPTATNVRFPSALAGNRGVTRAEQERLLTAAIRARRARDPKFLPGVPDTPEGIRRYFHDEALKRRRGDQELLGRAPGGLASTIAQLGGSVAGGAESPEFVPSLAIGGFGGGSLARIFVREGLVNAGIEAVVQPGLAQTRQAYGEELTADEAVTNVGVAGLFGGALEAGLTGAVRGGVKLADRLPEAVFNAMPESVQKRWADRMKVGDVTIGEFFADVDNRELGTFVRGAIGEDRLTPDERASLEILERDQEIGETSPFLGGPDGDGAHEESLGAALQALIDANRPAPSKGSLLASSSPIPKQPVQPAARVSGGRVTMPQLLSDVAYLKANGIPDHIAHGVAAGMFAESGGRTGALGPVTRATKGQRAFGLGQWLFDRKDRLVARYGANPTRTQQLDFLIWELKGGDHGGKSVLSARDPADALQRYIVDFMRPGRGAETAGDLKRGMQALGLEGAPVRSADAGSVRDVEGEDAALAELGRIAEEADAEALALSRAAGDPDADLFDAGGEPGPRPILRRELYNSDEAWLEAQIALQRAQPDPRRLDGAQEPAGAPPARETAAPAARQPTPIFAYHGTAGRFEQFDPERLGSVSESSDAAVGFWFTADRERAVAAASEAKAVSEDDLLNAEVMVAEIALANPKSIDVPIRELDPVDVADLAEQAKAAGHDGLIFEQGEGAGRDILVFDPARARPASWLRSRSDDSFENVINPPPQAELASPGLERFADPDGDGPKVQVESLEHDAKLDAAGDRPSRVDQVGPPPKRPRTFARAVAAFLQKRTSATGIAHRIDADDAISHGVDADAIYLNPNDRYPRVKVHLAGIFSTSKAPLRSRARPVKLHQLDYLGDVIDGEAYGIVKGEGERLEPEELAELFRASIENSDAAFDQFDPNFAAYMDWQRRYDEAAAIDALGEQPAHPVTGELLFEAQHRAEELRQSFKPADRNGSPGTHNIPNSAPVPGGGNRGELRVKIYSELLAKPALPGREAHLVLGPPAAGKSSLSEPLAAARGARIIDSDDAKALLPEFDDGVGAAAVHEESSRLAAIAADATIARGENLVLPLVGKTYEGLAARVSDLVGNGYRVYVHFVDLPIETAVERAMARYSERGRLVDPDYVRSVGDLPRENFERLIREFDGQLGGHLHVTNDVPLGQPPRLVAASDEEFAAGLGFARAAEPSEGARAPQSQPAGELGGADLEGLPELDAAARAAAAGDAQTYRLTPDGPEQTTAEILAELEAEDAAIAALQACL